MPSSQVQIADAAVAAIRALDLVVSTGPTVTLPADKVVKRKTPSLPYGMEPPAVVVVVGDAGADGETEALTATQKYNTYPTQVIVITAAGGRALGDDDTVREWRDRIEGALYDRQRETFASVDGFDKVRATGQPPFDGSVLGRDLNFSSQRFTVACVQTRES